MPEVVLKRQGMNYIHWEGFHKFFWRGRIMTGPRPIAPLLIFLVINIVAIIHLAFPLVFYVQQGNPFCLILWLIMLIATNTFLIITVITDPGNLPMIESK